MDINKAVAEYRKNFSDQGLEIKAGLKAALIDMDGVLYDSMKYHTLAWQRMVSEQGIASSRDEFYLYEGMTGQETIELIWRRETGKIPDADTIRKLYSIKAKYFIEMGEKELMTDADRMLQALVDADVKRILVTGSAQSSLLNRLDHDYPGVFLDGYKVTAHDVIHGKPNPEPYLRAQKISGTRPEETIVIENAPLGVRAGVAAGSFTIAVTTGPIPIEYFEKEKPDLIFPSMSALADAMPNIIYTLRN
ncbi:MAG: HAD hydrolase-like protein [Muribaculaceae bacterium]|nr:HAD hydrolase-like protein [Muribaculaceae bacterium]